MAFSRKNKQEIKFPLLETYRNAQIEFMMNPYDPERNSEGGIPVAIAENNLCREILISKLKCYDAFSHGVLNYTSPDGFPPTKSSFARFLSQTIFKSEFDARSENLIIAAGVTALLFLLSCTLFEENESVLIPTPYYPAFDPDFKTLGGVNVVEVKIPTDNGVITTEGLNESYNRSVGLGYPPKAFLLTNPHNPTGRIYSLDEIALVISWCQEKHIHLIADEIYALSIFDPSDDNPFLSVANIVHGKLGDYIHILWGLSKDFGASGARVGVLFSQNNDLLQSIRNIMILSSVPVLMQDLAAYILDDSTFVTDYLSESNRLLKRSYDLLTSSLDRIKVPYVRARSGLFLFVNFGQYLDEPTFEAEERLNQLFISRGIAMSSGASCHCQEPGYFRICYAWVNTATLEELVRRLTLIVEEREEQHRNGTIRSLKNDQPV